MTTIVRGIFVWWEDPTTGMAEWRYSGLELGEPSATQIWMRMKQWQYVNNWVYLQKVSVVR